MILPAKMSVNSKNIFSNEINLRTNYVQPLRRSILSNISCLSAHAFLLSALAFFAYLSSYFTFHHRVFLLRFGPLCRLRFLRFEDSVQVVALCTLKQTKINFRPAPAPAEYLYNLQYYVRLTE